MFKILRGLLRGVFRTVLLVVILVGLLATVGYGWFVHSRLSKTLAESGLHENYTTNYDFVSRKNAPVETALPLTVRAYVKRTKDHNWVPTLEHGLVYQVLQWSPDQNRWVVESRPALDVQTRLALEAMVRNPLIGPLIEKLKHPDPLHREVAYRELQIRTGMSFGYRPDASEADRARAVGEWETWWEKNRVRYGAGKVLEKIGEVIQPSKTP